MCPKGDVCGNCGAKATMEIHWPAWVEKLCDICAPKLVNRRIVVFFDLKEETNATTSVN